MYGTKGYEGRYQGTGYILKEKGWMETKKCLSCFVHVLMRENQTRCMVCERVLENELDSKRRLLKRKSQD